MNAPPANPSAAILETQERKIILLLCILAAIHVFIFSAAFPFFNNVDEPAHFDLVLKYSHGKVPRGIEMFSADSSSYLAIFSSCAYMGTPEMFPGHKLPPPTWTQPAEIMRRDFAINSAGWQAQKNYEVSQMPLYYALAGSWWRLGQWLGFEGGRWLYGLRFLNILFVAALVWLGYATARAVFPENSFLRLAVPALLSFMPQTAFYSIGNDVLSPLCFGATFICLLKWLRAENSSALLGTATGLAFAATYLAKTTNLPLLMVAATTVLLKTWQSFRRGKWRATLPAQAAFFCCAVPPIVGWMIWCKFNFGDFTGSRLKMEHFGWTIKPFSEWWHHPLFSPRGAWVYLSGQLSTFWQGEFRWRNQPLVLPGTDLVYTALSLALVAAALPALLPRFANEAKAQHDALRLSFVSFAAAVGFFALMSVIYDFHDCPNPSREHPYFQAGRMILGMLIPFLLLFVYGLDRLLNRFGNTAKFVALTAMILSMLISEIATDWPVFFNAYNWFHLP